MRTENTATRSATVTPHARRWFAPVPADRRVRRVAQLYVGLVLYGVANALMVLAGLGLDPWDTLHQGLSRTFALGIGTWTCIVGALVLLLWARLPQRPGLGTVSNVVVIGVVVDVLLAAVAPPQGVGPRAACLVVGVLLNGAATGAYIGAGLGPGPRDGLTVGLVAARGLAIRRVRTLIELTVLATGWLLGGTVGLGTVLYALSIGPITHVSIPALELRGDGPASGHGAVQNRRATRHARQRRGRGSRDVGDPARACPTRGRRPGARCAAELLEQVLRGTRS